MYLISRTFLELVSIYSCNVVACYYCYMLPIQLDLIDSSYLDIHIFNPIIFKPHLIVSIFCLSPSFVFKCIEPSARGKSLALPSVLGTYPIYHVISLWLLAHIFPDTIKGSLSKLLTQILYIVYMSLYTPSTH